MNSVALTNWTSFSNILYIGDEAHACIKMIEKFNAKLDEIEHIYSAWFYRRGGKNNFANHDRLQHHIQYHFEGGIAAFKFKNDDLPAVIRAECLSACRELVAGQMHIA
ncbi:hypothetical protein [Mucilaginibacter sp. L3T2-6]|uniref:hypothetical protein n=1 Tax=Mucilaginibacter sp. L3T2-6 TaxID=3062491 RepID=UPI002674B5A5|nr:hypothetical protein [Mucilaginibacter sp. L3T2-6]MDO3642597.1 hypothetical protein [Mucilaginibacter sp. L3T2-6]MDV6215007.1 hypothetical protein [Mucilaginibacter sp. L3T2-6]